MAQAAGAQHASVATKDDKATTRIGEQRIESTARKNLSSQTPSIITEAHGVGDEVECHENKHSLAIRRVGRTNRCLVWHVLLRENFTGLASVLARSRDFVLTHHDAAKNFPLRWWVIAGGLSKWQFSPG